jgi:hypothetical protein
MAWKFAFAAVVLAAAGCTGRIDGSSPPVPGGGGAPPPSPGGSPPGPGNPGPSNPGPGPGPTTPPPSGAAGAPTTCGPDQIGPSPLRRLTRLEYDNTVRDLLGERLPAARELGDDERAGVFPANFSRPMTELQFGQYAAAAAAAGERAVALMAKLLPCDPARGEPACATQFIRQFGRRAFRRPLDDTEAAQYEALFQVGRTGGGFGNGVKLVVQAMFESPHFIYLVEGPGALTQHQLANRLSYFLWKSPPDARLGAAADAGQLKTVQALRDEARRMLADPRAAEMLDDFHALWLALSKADTVQKDGKLYPEFEGLRGPVREETRRFVTHVLTEGDGRLATLLTASFSVVNAPLARLYGAAPPPGTTWQKVELDPRQRSGLLTQASFLAVHGAQDGSSPIHRGLAVREQFFCAELPPPPPDAAQNLPPPAPTRTTRQRTDQHRTDPSCSGCHQLMDVLGYAFESYDGIGRFRTTEGTVPVDDSGQIVGTDVDGPFKGARQLSERLVSSAQVQQCLVTQWFRYALGRLETPADRCALDTLARRFAQSDLKIPDLLLAIVESDAFRVRKGEE